MQLSDWLKRISFKFLPASCPLCGMTSHHAGCCQACEAELPWLDYACRRCGNLLPFDAQACGECLKQSPLYDNTIALFRYDAPIDHLILSVKFSKNLAYARMLGEMMSEKIRIYYEHDNFPDMILPVPLHTTRLTVRGFNQALEIARPIAKKFNIPLSVDQCTRIVATQPQATITADKRMGNIKNAFRLTRNLTAKHIAVFDDVVTTGSTVAELTRILKNGGAERIDVWCCARTLSPVTTRN